MGPDEKNTRFPMPILDLEEGCTGMFLISLLVVKSSNCSRISPTDQRTLAIVAYYTCSCMGQNFAYMQVKTVLSILFREYEIERIAPKEFPDCAYEDMVVGPKQQCIVKYKKRVCKKE